MRTGLFLSTALGASAFPFLNNPEALNEVLKTADVGNVLRDIMHSPEKRSLMTRQDYLGISKAQSNCGTRTCPTFDEKDQHVSVSGENVWKAPGSGDIRGPCPGLNAAANHGYLPRSGIASIEETVAGLGAAYNLGSVVTAALAAYAIATTGNLVQGVWSIGGPLPSDPLTSNLLGTGQGLSYSHNIYEGDSSIGRGDAYINNGDAHSLNVTRFEQVYNIAVEDGSDRYTLDKFRAKFEEAQDESIANNPYYFTGAFSTVVVVPAAYNFVINLMSNHSAEQPGGYLDGYNFKSFFGVTGEPGSFVWQKGQERIPEDWYRRPSYAPYEGPDVVGDVAIGYLAYPNTLKFGGNTGKVNTFTGLNVANLSGGVYSAETLFQDNNFACFSFQLLQNVIPDFLNKPLNALGPVTSALNDALSPLTGGLGCPQLGKLDVGVFDQFPGYKYQPNGPATNYRS